MTTITTKDPAIADTAAEPSQDTAEKVAGRAHSMAAWVNHYYKSLLLMGAVMGAAYIVVGWLWVDDIKAGIAENKAGIAENKAGIAENKAGIAENKAGIAENKASIDELNRKVDALITTVNKMAVDVNKMAVDLAEVRGVVVGITPDDEG